MIVLVKVNKTYKYGTDAKLAAYSSWCIGSLLDNEALRNEYKYLVAYANNEIVGTYQIQGLALANNNFRGNRRIKFNLADIDEKCSEQLVKIINDLKSTCSNKVKNKSPFSLISREHLNEFEVEHHHLNCNPLNEIPVLDSEELETLINLNGSHISNQYWLKITVKRNTYDSFSKQHSISHLSIAELHPNGKMTLNISNNASGKMMLVKNTISSSEKQDLLAIFTTFNNNSKNAIKQIIDSDVTSHVAHFNEMAITFESFEDASFTVQNRHEHWNGNVLFTKSGLLNDIVNLMTIC